MENIGHDKTVILFTAVTDINVETETVKAIDMLSLMRSLFGISCVSCITDFGFKMSPIPII